MTRLFSSSPLKLIILFNLDLSTSEVVCYLRGVYHTHCSDISNHQPIQYTYFLMYRENALI